jgi:hypothetical protein
MRGRCGMLLSRVRAPDGRDSLAFVLDLSQSLLLLRNVTAFSPRYIEGHYPSRRVAERMVRACALELAFSSSIPFHGNRVELHV